MVDCKHNNIRYTDIPVVECAKCGDWFYIDASTYPKDKSTITAGFFFRSRGKIIREYAKSKGYRWALDYKPPVPTAEFPERVYFFSMGREIYEYPSGRLLGFENGPLISEVITTRYRFEKLEGEKIVFVLD